MYSKGIGFDNCQFSWGHDEYLYEVIQFNKTHNPDFKWNIPDQGEYIIRFHSFYPWHSPIVNNEFCYKHLASPKDWEYLKHLQEFSSYDLYTKENTYISPEKIEELKDYYSNLIEKYIGTNIWYF